MIDISELRSLASDKEKVILTRHVMKRVGERAVTISDLISVIMSGEIIEQYPGDYPFPSCLIYGLTEEQNPLHIVCGLGNNSVWLITVYVPDIDEWEADFKTRKR